MVERSIIVPCHETPFDSLPADIRDMLNLEEAIAYRAGPAYFAKRAAKCQYRPMRKFFRMLGKASSMTLHLYAGPVPKYRAYFGMNFQSIDQYVQVHLGPGTLPGNPPPSLVQIYQDIDGTINGRENFGGWKVAEDIKSVAAHRWQPTETGVYSLEESYAVYSVSNGDSLGYAGPRKCFMHEHEGGGCMVPYRLLEYASEYFGDYVATTGI